MQKQSSYFNIDDNDLSINEEGSPVQLLQRTYSIRNNSKHQFDLDTSRRYTKSESIKSAVQDHNIIIKDFGSQKYRFSRENSKENLNQQGFNILQLKQEEQIEFINNHEEKEISSDKYNTIESKRIKELTFQDSIDQYFDNLIQIENEEKDWIPVTESLKIRIYKKTVFKYFMSLRNLYQEGSDKILIVKSFANIPTGTPEKVFQMMYNINIRNKWEQVLVNFEIIEKISENTDIIYCILKAPTGAIGVSDRDYCQQRSYKKDFPVKGAYTVHFKSVEHPKCPERKNKIRAETRISGQIFRPGKNNTTDVSIIMQTDPKGTIPKYIVNLVAARAPKDWVKTLTKACTKY